MFAHILCSFIIISYHFILQRGIGKVSIDFQNSVDILPIHHYLSTIVIQGKGAGKDAAGAITYDASAVMNGGSTGIFDIFGSNYAQINKHEVESKLKSMSILLSNEKVEMAFKCGRKVRRIVLLYELVCYMNIGDLMALFDLHLPY